MLTTKKSAAISPWWLLVLVVVLLAAGCTPPGPRALLDGEKLIKQEKYREAVEKLKLATQLLPTNAQSWNHLGLAYHGLGEYEKAIEAYQKALTINPDLESVRYNLGVLYLQTDRPGDAARELTSFVVMRPTSVDGLVKLGSAQIRLGDWDRAATVYTQAYKASPTSPDVLNGLGLIQMHRRQLGDARRFFQAALEERPKFPPAMLNIAVLKHEHEGDKPGALQAYREYLLLEPKPPKYAEVERVVERLYLELNPASATMVAQTGPTNPATGPRPLTFASLTNRLAEPPAATNAAPLIAPAAAPVTNRLARLTEPLPTTPEVVPPPTPAVVEPAPDPVPVTPDPAPVVPEVVVTPPVTNVVESTLEKLEAALAATMGADPGAVEPVRTPEPLVETTTRMAPPVPDVAASEPERPEPVVVTPPTGTIPSMTGTPPTPAATDSRAEFDRKLSEISSPAPPVVETAEAEERPGFFQRINPVNMFRNRDRETRTTPLTADEAATVTAIPAEPEPAPSPYTPAPRPPAPEAPLIPVSELLRPVAYGSLQRYTYRRPGVPAPGDRAKADPYFQRGTQYHRTGSLPEAITAYQTAIANDPSYFEAYYNLGLASYLSRRMGLSLQALEQALALQPDSTGARFNFARSLEQSGYYADAATEYQGILRRNPNDEQAHLALAHLYAQRLGDNRMAAAHYRHVLANNPQHSQAAAIKSWLAAR